MGSKEYATVQIDKKIKDQIVEHCDRTGLRIGRFVENLYNNFVSSSRMPNTSTTVFGAGFSYVNNPSNTVITGNAPFIHGNSVPINLATGSSLSQGL